MESQVPVVDAPVVVEQAEVEAPLSIMEHAAEFGPNRDRSAPPATSVELPANATPEEKAAHHSAQQKREKETGQFTEGKRRNRAAKDAASPADVPRIQELSRKNKELTDELAKYKAMPPVQAPNGNGNGNGHAAPEVAPQAVQRPQAPLQARSAETDDPEPKEADEKYAADPMKFFQEWSRWNVRDEHRKIQATQTQQQREFDINSSFAQRAAKVIEDKKDFAEVVGRLDAAKAIPKGSVVDEFILTDDNGPNVLYHLASNPQQLDALLQIPVFQQMKHLALLSQRFDASPPSQTSGVTGSDATPKVRYLPPKPPNPVRTEAQRASGGPAPTDGSLSVMSHAKQFRRS